MDSREAHQMVLDMAESSIEGLPDTEARKSAIQITRRDLTKFHLDERRERDRKKPENQRDDLPMNRAQIKSLYKVWMRDHRGLSFADVLELAEPAFDGSGAIMVQVAGMWLGIETDGYTHS